MKIGIIHRLFLAILAAAGLAVVSLVLIMQWNFNRGVLAFVNSMEKSGVSRLAANGPRMTRIEQVYADLITWGSCKKIVIPECRYRGTRLFRHLESGFPIRITSGMTSLGLCKKLSCLIFLKSASIRLNQI